MNICQIAMLAAVVNLVMLGAQAADMSDPAYKEGYEAGYKAALEALKKRQGEVGGDPGIAVPAGPVAAAPSATPAAAPSGLPPDWWNHSALMYPKRETEWRHGGQANLAGSSLAGNDSGSVWRGTGNFYSRKGHWTNEVTFMVDKRNLSQSGTPNVRDSRMFQESLRYDLTDKWYAAGGLILEKDSVFSIDQRLTLLAGPGYYWIDNQKVRLNTFLGLARFREKYAQDVVDAINISQRSSGMLYFYETLNWQIAQDWSLSQGYRHMRDLSTFGQYALSGAKIQDVYRYRYKLSLGINYHLNPRSAISWGFDKNMDSNPWPGVMNRDLVRRLSFNMMF